MCGDGVLPDGEWLGEGLSYLGPMLLNHEAIGVQKALHTHKQTDT